MNISAPFIKRPIGTSLLTLALLLSGILAFNFLPVAPLPQVEFPVIQVSAGLPGASPETMASAVATPLERQFGRIAGVNQMTSSSQLGSTSVVLQFDLNRNIDAAGRDVQAAINAARSQLPANLPGNPNYRKVNPADAPILILALTSDLLTLPQMYDVADSILAQKLAQVDGVGQVFAGGGAKPAVRAEVNPTLLNKLGVGLDTVRAALTAANANSPKGEVADPVNAWTLNANDQIFTADQYRRLIVSYNNGAPVRLGDVGTVTDSVADIRNIGLSGGKPAVLIIVFRQPGANIISTVDRVRAALPQLKSSISPAIDVNVVLDRTTTVRASVHDIEFTLLISVVLVILVVFAFLRTFRATIIPSVAVPLSLVGTFGVMYLLGYSLDNLSLMALTISTGFVVDDAIVMIENISRYIEQGDTPLQAALKGSEQIGFTILSLTVSLIAVLIPLLFMGDIVGRLFREFAVTLAVTIIVSAFVSLTLTPMMSAKLLRHQKEEDQSWFYRNSEHAFNSIIAFYGRTLKFVLRYRTTTLLITAATLVGTILLYIYVPKGFFPVQDAGAILGVSEGPQDVSFAAMSQRQRALADVILKDPAVESLSSFIGIDGTNTTLNSGRIQINLKPLEQRKISASDVIRRLQPEVAKVDGVSLFMQPVQDLTVEDRVSRTQFQYSLEDVDGKELAYWVPRFMDKLKTLPELRDVASDQQNRGLLAVLTIDRDTASRLGIFPADIDNALYDAFGQRLVSTIFTQLNQYHVVLEVDPQFQQDPDSLKNIYVRSSTGQAPSSGSVASISATTGPVSSTPAAQIPLSAFTRFEPSNTALTINHQGQFPVVTLSFNLAPNASLGEAVNAINSVKDQLGMPPSIQATFQGTAAAFLRSLSNEPILILAALVTVYIVLGVLYESYIHPITILSTLPSAGVGAILALLLCRTEFSIIALIGIILLIGIVKKNAIMMIDFALDAERKEGKAPLDAIYEACLLRFRPIMMTTMAALLGGLPLALGAGVGSELRRPLGITIVGGLILSQLLTLYTTPVVYLAFDWLAHRFSFHVGNPIEEPVHGTAPGD